MARHAFSHGASPRSYQLSVQHEPEPATLLQAEDLDTFDHPRADLGDELGVGELAGRVRRGGLGRGGGGKGFRFGFCGSTALGARSM